MATTRLRPGERLIGTETLVLGNLTVDRTGPVTGSVTPAPSAANSQAVAVGATAGGAGHREQQHRAAEYFIDTAGADGSGTALRGSQRGIRRRPCRSDPGTTVAALAAGTRAILVHARCRRRPGTARGRYLLVDRAAPTFQQLHPHPELDRHRDLRLRGPGRELAPAAAPGAAGSPAASGGSDRPTSPPAPERPSAA